MCLFVSSNDPGPTRESLYKSLSSELSFPSRFSISSPINPQAERCYGRTYMASYLAPVDKKQE